MTRPLFELQRPDSGSGGLRPHEDPTPIPSIPVSGLGGGGDRAVSPAAGSAGGSSKIQAFEQKLGSRHSENWNRTPNTTGTGAIHVKSFHSKLTGDSLSFLDAQINEWLDAHPEYEVKMVTTSVGEWTGKLKEPNLIVNVWV
ncbi:MAG: hypothetical protein KF757_10495 [Phycisphaeraceae bacterium]|nr:hypothetical protein [Phycisphaeraceae bacterium]MCW5764090.1 hypothetical protein [Phycisphaeraceae bacterium]